MSTPHTPAGWYSDPDGSGGQRYWDGHTWTEHQVPAPAAAPPEPQERVGAHRAPDDPPEPPAQTREPEPGQFTSAPTAFSQPSGSGDRQLLIRYLAVCAGLLAVLVAVGIYAAFFSDDGSLEIGAFENPTTLIAPATPGGDWGENPTGTPDFSDSGDYADGPLEFSVNAVEVTTTVASADFPVDKTAEGEYVVVHLTVTNTSDEPTTFLGTFQKLLAGGQVYSIDDEATFYANGALVDLNPGDQAEVGLVYDVPPGTDPDAIELHADPLGPGVEASLP